MSFTNNSKSPTTQGSGLRVGVGGSESMVDTGILCNSFHFKDKGGDEKASRHGVPAKLAGYARVFSAQVCGTVWGLRLYGSLMAIGACGLSRTGVSETSGAIWAVCLVRALV